MAPVVVCKNATVYLNANGQGSVSAAEVYQSGSDNCGTVSPIAVTPGNFNCSHLTTNNVVSLTVTDSHDNASTCNTVVKVLDALAPTMLCKNATILLDASGNAVLSPFDINNGSFDNCTVAALSLSQTSFNCAHSGSNTVVLTGADASGNTASCSAVVTVKDQIAPQAKCKNVSVILGAGGSVTVPQCKWITAAVTIVHSALHLLRRHTLVLMQVRMWRPLR